MHIHGYPPVLMNYPVACCGVVHRVAARKLEQLNAATVLETLRVPPGNWLEALTHDRQGQHSIRVNDQWRVCFVWSDGNAFE